MKKNVSVALAALVMLVFVGCQSSCGNVQSVGQCDSVSLSIAYINTDSLLLGYDYAKKMNDVLIAKEESSRADFNQKYRTFQQDAVEFQRKVQNNGFLSMERAQKEQQRLQQAEQDLQELNDRLSADLMREQSRVNKELRDTLVSFLDGYAKGKYRLVLSNMMGDNVLYSAPGVDITADVVSKLNGRYAEATKK